MKEKTKLMINAFGLGLMTGNVALSLAIGNNLLGLLATFFGLLNIVVIVSSYKEIQE